MGSRVPQVIDALVTLARADAALADVRVSDGPEVTDSSAKDWLIVGFDGDPAGDFQAAQTLGGWAGLSARSREEQWQVMVAAIAQRGDTDVRAARVRAYEIGARVEEWLAADPSIGLGVGLVEAAIEASQLTQDQTDRGAQAVLLLTVAGKCFT
ncbi:hypothetical protein [Streptomyces sp. SLBN-134]|uniref:hypothetical protein n=1 Tax=Streptomyces sp. SLBN-134 TaxID=2768456 RepID=UPI0011534B08|nr:hypothetical protein [Streptomyces sp. SLBN-134]TQL21968.1 hypothetical protein FBY37_3986 [Streptomyces sp. SLBN-134]